jgi:hypothetical protein
MLFVFLESFRLIILEEVQSTVMIIIKAKKKQVQKRSFSHFNNL